MSEVTRSMEATSAPAAARAATLRKTLPNGIWGIALVIAAEATLFCVLIGTYFYLRFYTAQWPPAGVPLPKVAVPAILTGVLVLTTIPMYLSDRAARRGNLRATWLFVFAALFVQAGYFGMQVHQYLGDLDKFSPKGSAYASIYFVMLGADHAHVAIGLLLNAWLLLKLLGGFTNYRLIAVRVLSFYWYFVNLATVAVFLTLTYPSF